jgi:hypothetical protein
MVNIKKDCFVVRKDFLLCTLRCYCVQDAAIVYAAILYAAIVYAAIVYASIVNAATMYCAR